MYLIDYTYQALRMEIGGVTSRVSGVLEDLPPSYTLGLIMLTI